VCLLAMLLLQAPAFAGFVIAAGVCCSGDVCPIHGHHQAKQQPGPAPMDCDHEHHSDSSLHSCTISCCHDAPSSTLHPHQFVPAIFYESTELAPLSTISAPTGHAPFSPLFAPNPPPPKFFTA
jgi:hypothetical protein